MLFAILLILVLPCILENRMFDIFDCCIVCTTCVGLKSSAVQPIITQLKCLMMSTLWRCLKDIQKPD